MTLSIFFVAAMSPLEMFVVSGIIIAISLYLYRRQISWQLSQLLMHMLSNDTETQPTLVSKWLSSVFSHLERYVLQLTNERNGYIETLNAINDAVIRTDAAGKISAVNKACLALFSCQQENLLHNDYDLCQRAIEVPEDHVDFHEVLKKLSVKQRTNLYKSVFHVDMNNRILAIERQVTPVYSGDELIGTVVVLRDVTTAEKLRKRLRFQANHDNVTKLFNRYKFEQRLTDAWHDAQENSEQHALLQMDMDRFKLINDNAGHAAGDQLLRDVANILKLNVRSSDICARIGGDEFAILLYQVTPDIVQSVMNKLNLALKQLPFSASGQVFEVGASIGGTLINAKSPHITELKRQADAACFIAKNKGINNNQLFSQNDDQLMSLQQEPRWAARIHQALESDEFALFYQSIQALDNIDNPKQHIEILLRLQSGGKLLSPNVFLPAVERFRLTDKVDYWVVSKTFAWFEQQPELWQKQVIAINLSGDSITNEHFITKVLECQRSYNFPSSAICFEITETAAIADMNLARQMVDRLQMVGFNIALDDFGKGFSTFSYLKSLPAQYIKIDGSYVEEILTSESDHSIVKAIATMAKTMDMKTIAEFVQCDETMNLLSDLGVDFVQGYGIALPKPLADYHKTEPIH
ncbi:EAL domain-containing protein [Thalassotalea sp. M1531]|uniref:EAL domain-containing protein n=1 Tax=Thalassotalea algicola TaxID=2716224 RepID=A0A7Y0Q614_9GAMM|nr:EAL domain-containing protein [Thalassotalea algicola]NMP30903.1 EAL domain-containing protein [Thalassotalea algicola]